MHLLTTISLLLPLTLASTPPFPPWHAPASDSIRGPCPGLNALANHDLIPTSGTNITLPNVVTALAALNISTELATILFTAALSTSPDPASGAFSLQDLGRHGLLEHDGSLSRRDEVEGKACLALDWDVYGKFLADVEGASGNGNGGDVTVRAAARARWNRIVASRTSNPKFRYTASDRLNSYAESGIYFQVLMDAKKGTVPLNWLKIFFEQERYPWDEGWRPLNRANGFSMAGIILRLALNTPEEAQEVAPSVESFHAQFPESG